MTKGEKMKEKKYDSTVCGPSLEDSMLESDLFHLKEAEEALLIDKHTILELVRQFLQDRAHYVEPLKTSLSQRDWNNLSAYAHRLKGAAGNLRVSGIAEPALVLESAAKEKQANKCEDQLELIEQRFSVIVDLVNQI